VIGWQDFPAIAGLMCPDFGVSFMSNHDSSPVSEDQHAHEHHSHSGTYFLVFCALCVFTLMSILADYYQFSNKNLLRAIILAVASSKAMCVMMYFMHLKFEGAWKYLLLAPTFILAFTIPFALMPDVGMHYYTVDVPQVYEYESQNSVVHAPHATTEPKHP